MSLHKFIESMSKAEKRYFKIYAQIGKKSPPKYVHLFDFINKQTEYSEESIKEKGFTSDDKNLLIEKILDAIHTLQLHKSVDAELHLMLSYFSILHEKKQWNLLNKYIKRAKKIAKDNERFSLLIEMMQWEQNLIFKTVKNDFYEKMDALIQEKEAIIEQLNNELAYSNLNMRIDALLVGDKALSQSKNKAIFERLMDAPLLQQNAKPLSKKAKIDYLYAKAISCRYTNEKEQAHHYYQLILELFNKNEFLFYITDYTAFYVKIWFWEKASSIELKDEKSTQVTKILEELPIDSFDVNYTIHIQSLTHCIRTLNKSEGIELIAQAEQKWASYTKHIKETRLSVFSYTIMLFYCMFEEWDKAQKWLDKITVINRMTDRKYIQMIARIWQLVICYERTPYELNKHIQSAYKYFVRNEHYFDIEKQILQTFRDLYKAITYKEKKIIWQQLIDFFKTIPEEEMNSRRGLKNLNLWCESKMTQTKTIELIQELNKKHSFLYV